LLSSAPKVDPPGYPLQEFERRLAALEAAIAADPKQAHRLAFASSVEGRPTHQFYFDRFVKLVRRSVSDHAALLELAVELRDGHRAEAHNYLTHGIHSYKGKYFPQIVRSLVNAAGLAPGSVVADPFVGSGTTTLEAALIGMRAVGLDRNPLAAVIARTKVDVLKLEVEAVRAGHAAIEGKLRRNYRADLPNRAYLERWFPKETIRVIERIVGAIANADAHPTFKDLARLSLSTHFRAWSLQEPTQLRIFRRSTAPPATALLDRFKQQLSEYTASVVVGLRLLSELGVVLPPVDIRLADSRVSHAWGCSRGSVDAVVTSPPYATALPYIDTDRLSIFCLGLADVGERSELEWEMIGTREILKRQRNVLEDALERNVTQLPQPIIKQIRAIRAANKKTEVGFRRQNLPALLYRYFSDMQRVLANTAAVLRKEGLCGIVIGDSYTVAGDNRVRIRTADFLEFLAEQAGLRRVDRIAMGGQTAYLPHQRNGIPAEDILLFTAP